MARKRDVEPTIKQKMALRNAVENGGNISKAMRDAGYSPRTAHNPSKLTESRVWPQLMKKFLPDSLIIKKHHDLLNATTAQFVDDEYVGEKMDAHAVAKGLEMAYKLKGRYAPEKHMIIDDEPDPELEELAMAVEEEIKEKLRKKAKEADRMDRKSQNEKKR